MSECSNAPINFQDSEALGLRHSDGGKSVEALEALLESMCKSLEDTIDKRYEKLAGELERRFAASEQRVEQIAEAAGVRETVSAGDDDMDRKRLKANTKQNIRERKESVQAISGTPYHVSGSQLFLCPRERGRGTA